MAKDKKTILIYADWIHSFENLDDDEAGKLIKHFFRYVNDLNPTPPDKITKIAFEPIKQHLKRDLVKYEGIKETRSGAGKASAEKRKREAEELNKIQQNEQVLNLLNTDQQSSTNSTLNGNGNVNDNVKEREREKNLSIKNSMLAAQQNLESAAMQHSTSTENIVKFFNDFWHTNDYDTNETNQTESEIRIHFNRWLKKNKPPQIKFADEWGEYEKDYYCAFFSEKTEPEKYKEAIEAGFVKYSDTELRFKIIKKQAQ